MIRYAPLLVFVLVSAYLGISAAKVTWHALGLTQGVSPEVAVRRDPPGLATDIGPILALAPFGAVPRSPDPAPVAAQKTSLDLVLRGVIVAAPVSASIAYIANGSQPERVFGIGDSVAKGAVLSAVHPDYVILDVDGYRETLSLPKEPDRVPGGTIQAKVLAPSGQTLPRKGSAPVEVIDFWRRRIEANPQSVLDQLGLTASQDGYRIRAEPHPGVRRAGFRPGDLIARVNGQQVGDVNTDRVLYDRIAASGRARVELIRDGQSIILSFPLE